MLGLAPRAEVAGCPDDDNGRRLTIALDRLVDSDREVLLLHAVGVLDSEALALALGISGDALRQRLARARRRLTKALNDLERLPAAAVAKGAR